MTDKALPDAAPADTINLSLVSHTNAGKTTLVRTLIQQDVGEVRDAAHVTEVATGYVMVQDGPRTLMLWDTPGFGDTARLVSRLRASGNPIGWFLGQVWDRFKDRPLWSSQQAVRNARDEANVVLYLVNASEDPASAAYVPLEMEVLAWVGKPIVLLLNQTGPPGDDGHAEEERWGEHLASIGLVKATLTLDAFARCWVQERTLLLTIKPLLSERQQQAMDGLIEAWTKRNLERFHEAIATLASQLAGIACDREEIGDRKWHDRVRGAVTDPAGNASSREAQRAMGRLGERADQAVRSSTDRLIELHGLSGRAAQEVLKRMRDDYTEAGSARESVAAILGGLFTGAAGGLAADLAAGGLTLGAGMVLGGLLGAVGAGSAAHGYNLVRGDDSNSVRWSEEFFVGLVRSALLRYLAVAHFGRGRGQWEEGEHPTAWREAVSQVVEAQRSALRSIWRQARDSKPEAVVAPLDDLIGDCAGQLLSKFYPDSADLFEHRDVVEQSPGNATDEPLMTKA